MNTEEEIRVVVGRTLLGAGAMADRNLLMFFFQGHTIAVRAVGGALIWESYEDKEH